MAFMAKPAILLESSALIGGYFQGSLFYPYITHAPRGGGSFAARLRNPQLFLYKIGHVAIALPVA